MQVSLGPLNKLFNRVRPVVASAVLRFPVSSALSTSVWVVQKIRNGVLKGDLTSAKPWHVSQAFGSLIGSIGGIDASAGAITKAIKEGSSVGICPGEERAGP